MPEAPPPHQDFSKLRRYHNYYRVLRVGPYRHHFVAFYHHFELVTAVYDATLDGKPRFIGEGYGLITARPSPEPIPPAVTSIARALRRDLERRREAKAANVTVIYSGAYREVEVEELVVRQPRKGTTYDDIFILRRRLPADEALTALGEPPRFQLDFGGTFRKDDPSELLDRPQWIDAGLGRQGKAQLWNLHDFPESFAPEVRRAFEAATLSSARRVLANEPGLPLAELGVERDARVLPPDLEDRRGVIFYLNGLVRGGGRRQFSAELTMVLERAIGGEERGTMRLSVPTNRHGDVLFDAEVLLRAPPLPPGANGEIELPFEFAYRIRSSNVLQTPQVAQRMPLSARAIVDGDRVHVIDFDRTIPMHRFAGLGEYDAFEAHLGLKHSD